jgi:predicted nucleic-acid-binding protein
MSKFNKTMEDIFNVTPLEDVFDNDLQEYIPRESNLELSAVLDHDLKTDYEKTRDNIDSLISKGTEAIDDMLAIARQSEKARDFEVAGNMIKTVVDASKELLEIQKKMRDITGKKENLTQNIKNAVFVGSGKDFIKSIKDEMSE